MKAEALVQVKEPKEMPQLKAVCDWISNQKNVKDLAGSTGEIQIQTVS